jgi:hypothetical protein
MAQFSTSQVLFIASAAFLGGLVVSLFSSPRSGAENRRWLADSTEEIQEKVRAGSKEFKTKNLPNLYEATENIGLTDDDLLTNN